MKKLQQHNILNWARVGAFFGLGILTGLVLLIMVARYTWHTKFYPGITIAGVEVAGLTREQAKAKLNEQIDKYSVSLTYNGNVWSTPKNTVSIEVEPTLNNAYRYGRRFLVGDYLLLLINKQTNFPLLLSEGKTDNLDLFINELAGVIEIPPVEPLIEVVGGKIKIVDGSDGILIDGEKIQRQIRDAYAYMSASSFEIPILVSAQQLTHDELELIRARAETLIDKGLVLTLDDDRVKLGGKELVSLLMTDGGPQIFDKKSIEEYVQGLSESLNKEPADARFEFADGVVKEFAPGKDGVEIDVELTVDNLMIGVEKLLSNEVKSEQVQISANRTSPKITTDKVNELGIKERIGRGESYYAHSIPNRIYNVGLASTRANSALIAPGEEFSFNKVVGDISGASGYRSAYVISGGRTVLGDGGGVCQVSTTLFRGAMSAGLPIIERWGHAYRVGYYEQNSKPGIDATVYSPSKDLRFLNDTPGHILVQTINDPKNLHLVVEIYGTSDGRIATISEPKLWGITPALPTIYQDDPTLPNGTVKQVDWAAAGAKTSFEYKVTRNGETLQDKIFSTTYRPWASVYLKGTGI